MCFIFDDAQASRGWRSQRSRWFFRAADADKVTIKFWSQSNGQGQFEVLDEEDRVLQTGNLSVQQGMNTFEWDLLLDQDLALAVEQIANADKDKVEAKDTPLQQSVELGHPLYVLPGDYTVRVTLGRNTASNDLIVQAPKDFESRGKSEPKLRGKKSS